VTAAGLWIADQISDRLALIEIATPSEYGVTKLIREIPTQSSNTSGLAVGASSLWVAANGPATLWRKARATDAASGEILQVDPESGRTLQRWPVPGGGGVHGIEYDPYDEGHLWITTLAQQTLTKVRIADWSIQQVIPLPYRRAHGVVCVEDGVWVVHTADRIIVKLSVEDGQELDRIVVPATQPEPHCLSRYADDLLYCDATSGWVVRIAL
jgi:hypothetical protein